MVLCCVRVMAGKHVDLNAIINYLQPKKYSDSTSEKGDKANFRRVCKKFILINVQMMYKINRLIIIDGQHRTDITHDVHQGLGDNAKAVALSSLMKNIHILTLKSRFY